VHARVDRDLRVGAVVDDDDVADGLQLVHQRPEQRQQRPVDEDDLVLGVVGDVDQLLGEQPDVQRVQHPPGARRGQVELQVAPGVPAERADPAVRGDLQGVQDRGEAAHPGRPLGDRRGRLAGGLGRHDPLVAEVLLGSVEDVGEGEWPVLHQPEHRRSFDYCGVTAEPTCAVRR
jgi:hypothetical protein